jgi:hypothetical protein
MRKFHKLLHGEGALYGELLPTQQQEDLLRAAKNKIRNRLRARIEAASVAELGVEKPVSPRFRTQGSWAYKSCVQPAQDPQEMDWDYGVYLPVDVLDDAGTPKVAAAAYFDLVERLLTELSDEEDGWSMGKEKNHCIRVHVADWAHVDVALYAAPAAEFEKVNDRYVETALNKRMAADSISFAEQLSEAAEISTEQSWEDFDDMMVATRKGVWERSDAEEVARWFRQQNEVHGEQLQRVWRYLKAWRDAQWKEGGPSSVALMLVATRHFEKCIGRDDRALAKVSKYLSGALSQDIFEEGIDPDHNFNRLNTAERKVASDKATSLASALDQALSDVTSPKSRVIALLRSQWGMRVPDREADVEHDSPAEQVRETPARKVVAPVVGSSYAG